MDVDLIITGGMVIDGTGHPAYRADVAIKDGRIVDIGNIAAPAGVTVLNARGLIVTPGFIDVHSHSDFTIDDRSACRQFCYAGCDFGSRGQLRPWLRAYR